MLSSGKVCPWLYSYPPHPSKSSKPHAELVYLFYVGIQSIPLPLPYIRPSPSLRTPPTAPEMPPSVPSSPCVRVYASTLPCGSFCGAQMWCAFLELGPWAHTVPSLGISYSYFYAQGLGQCLAQGRDTVNVDKCILVPHVKIYHMVLTPSHILFLSV